MARKIKDVSAIEAFKKHANDTGSVEVQIALLTQDIERLSGHAKENPKDFSSKRGLLKLVGKRRTFLKYIERKNNEHYQQIVDRLNKK